MDNKRIDMYERRFKDHVATVKQLDEETQVLTFKRPDSIIWSTEFIFRKNFILSVEILAVQYFLQHGNRHGIMIGKTQVQNILQKSARLSFKKNMY